MNDDHVCPTCGQVRSWSKEAIVRAIQRWAEEHGGPPVYRDWKASNRPDHSWPSVKVVESRFGTWAAALRAAGFEPQFKPHHHSVKERALLLADTSLPLAEIAEHLEVPVTTIATWYAQAGTS